jgi:hypothetical protein
MVKANSASSIATEVGQPRDDQPRALKNESALRSNETELQARLASHAEAIVAALGRGGTGPWPESVSLALTTSALRRDALLVQPPAR